MRLLFPTFIREVILLSLQFSICTIINMTFIIGTAILGMFFLLDLANAQISNSSSSKDDYLPIIIITDHSDVTTNFKSWNSRPAQHHHRQLRVVHGVVNIFGWGILLPMGVIIARCYKRLPMKCEEWYSLHVQSKVGGFILGTIGWGLGISIRNSITKDHQHTMMMSTHGIIGTIIFTFTTIQVLAICLQPDEENVYRKYWVIYHNIFGYTLIILTIVNIFQGIEKEEESNRWKWSYGVLVSVMGLIALILEFLPCFNMIKNKLSM